MTLDALRRRLTAVVSDDAGPRRSRTCRSAEESPRPRRVELQRGLRPSRGFDVTSALHEPSIGAFAVRLQYAACDVDPRGSALERRFWRWVDEYVTQPHPQLGRDGPICPFVGRLVESGNLHVEIDETVHGDDAAAMEIRMRTAVAAYRALPNAHRKALVVVFANVTGDDVAVVDGVQDALKGELVPQGLMIGQFHPTVDGAWCAQHALSRQSRAVCRDRAPADVGSRHRVP